MLRPLPPAPAPSVVAVVIVVQPLWHASPHLDTSLSKVVEWEKVKFTKGRISLGHFWYVHFCVPEPTLLGPFAGHDIACLILITGVHHAYYAHHTAHTKGATHL